MPAFKSLFFYPVDMKEPLPRDEKVDIWNLVFTPDLRPPCLWQYGATFHISFPLSALLSAQDPLRSTNLHISSRTEFQTSTTYSLVELISLRFWLFQNWGKEWVQDSCPSAALETLKEKPRSYLSFLGILDKLFNEICETGVRPLRKYREGTPS